jgi:hypothetical protein
MLIDYQHDADSIILRVKILNSAVATGAGLTGLTFSSAGLIISTIADNEAAATTYTQAGSTIETIATLGTYAAPTATKCRFKEVDATNHPGVYEIQFADARFAVASAKALLVSVAGATNCAETDFVIPLRGNDPFLGWNITASGNIGIDWATIENPGTEQTLSSTTTGAVNTAGLLTAFTGDAKTDVDAIKADTGNLVARVTATLFSGITSLAEWLGLLAGKQAADATAQTEIRATGAGSGTYDPTAESLEAIRDRGDAAWITATSVVVSDKTGFKLASDGADLVLVDGKTLPAALQIIAAGVLGKVSGAGTGTEVFVGVDGSTTRATVTVDGSGNRSEVVYG